MSVILCAHRNAHSSVVGVVNEIIIIIIITSTNLCSGDMFDAEGGGEEPEWVQKEREQFKNYRDKDGNGYLDKEEVRILNYRFHLILIT